MLYIMYSPNFNLDVNGWGFSGLQRGCTGPPWRSLLANFMGAAYISPFELFLLNLFSDCFSHFFFFRVHSLYYILWFMSSRFCLTRKKTPLIFLPIFLHAHCFLSVCTNQRIQMYWVCPNTLHDCRKYDRVDVAFKQLNMYLHIPTWLKKLIGVLSSPVVLSFTLFVLHTYTVGLYTRNYLIYQDPPYFQC